MILGIDPGITGAVVLLDDDGALVWAHRTPVIKDGKSSKRLYDVPGMVALVSSAASSPSHLMVGMEKVGAMPRDGKVGVFSFGTGYGMWQGILAALAVPYALVTPQAWQGRMLAGRPRGPHTKTSAVAAAKAMFPTLDLSVKADWGKADAALIAAHTRRAHHGLD